MAGIIQPRVQTLQDVVATPVATDLQQLQYSSSTGLWSPSTPAIAPANILYRYRADTITVGPSDASEVTIVSQTIPAGVMTTTGILRCFVRGDMLNNSAAGKTMIARIYAGGTKIFDSAASTSITNSVNRRMFLLDAAFINLSAANVNRMAGSFSVGAAAGPTTGLGALVAASFSGSIGSVTPLAIDTSIAWIWKVTLQLSASDPAYEMRISSVYTEIL